VNRWELTDVEIVEARNACLKEATSEGRNWAMTDAAVAKAAQRKLLEWLKEEVLEWEELGSDGSGCYDVDFEKWRRLCESLKVEP
jgi:hypothetical protein